MIFKEKQKFTQPWLWILLIIVGILVYGIFGLAFYKQIVHGQPIGNHPMNNFGFIIFSFFILSIISLIFLLFAFGNLTTIIDKDEISLRFFPFHLSFKKFPWSSIERFEVISYKAISEYGGWGIRYGNKGKAYNVRGKTGLQLYFKNGRKLLIGTQKAPKLSDFLKKNINLQAKTSR